MNQVYFFGRCEDSEQTKISHDPFIWNCDTFQKLLAKSTLILASVQSRSLPKARSVTRTDAKHINYAWYRKTSFRLHPCQFLMKCHGRAAKQLWHETEGSLRSYSKKSSIYGKTCVRGVPSFHLWQVENMSCNNLLLLLWRTGRKRYVRCKGGCDTVFFCSMSGVHRCYIRICRRRYTIKDRSV